MKNIIPIIAALFALTLNPVSAAVLTIDLDSACNVLASPCEIPVGGVILHDFITLSSPDGAEIVNPDADPLNAGLALFALKTADFAFDETKALVTDIAFLGSTGANSLTYTVFETELDSDSITKSNQDFAAMITGYESIIKLQLNNAVEGSARQFVITYTPVPVPAAAWLFGSGLIGLGGIAGRKRRS